MTDHSDGVILDGLDGVDDSDGVNYTVHCRLLVAQMEYE